MEKTFYVYIITNRVNSVLYTGVTSDLKRRIYEHKNKLIAGFTSQYNVGKLVYFESGGDANAAIARQKQIKAGSRQKKVNLVNRMNPHWRDLFDDL